MSTDGLKPIPQLGSGPCGACATSFVLRFELPLFEQRLPFISSNMLRNVQILDYVF